MISATVDTSVLAPAVRGFSNPENRLGEVLRQWRRGAFQLVVSQPILDELRRTLANSYFSRSVTERQRHGAIELLRTRGIVVPITILVVGIATHPEDDLILATALSARSDYLVTGDRQLLKLRSHRGVRIVGPESFLALL